MLIYRVRIHHRDILTYKVHKISSLLQYRHIYLEELIFRCNETVYTTLNYYANYPQE